MLFRRTSWILGFAALILVLRTALPAAEGWPTAAWLTPLLFVVFLLGPFAVALDVRDGRYGKSGEAASSHSS
jgi:hypothetical protein